MSGSSPSASASLLDGRELDRLFAPLRGAGAVLVAVSGGPDSVALLHLLARWPDRPRLVAATIDHGLRPEAAGEAGLVAACAARLGVEHRILPWLGPKPSSGLQATARDARYTLLASLARTEGATHLATAHTEDDQAETLLMRLAAGSGLSGLVGMRPETMRDGLWHVRPLLAVPKAVLVDLCRREGWPFAEDPSNADPRFARVRWRRLMPLLAAEGLTPARLSRLSARARRIEEALDAAARAAFAAARVEAAGPLKLRASFLADEPFEIAVRTLALAVLTVRNGGRHARLERIEAAAGRLRAALAAGRALRLTLAGTVITLDAAGLLGVSAETARRRGRYAFVSDSAAAPTHSLGKGEGCA
ncbi:MAG TPA: tRNA lysidine(34) synthetase TilS [Microvirga sp.]|jgi:tRNA(Ile)-lysidine synthase|nr:tRNA lysidine(34) synthetase TilS [Microvirga sp.]